MASVVGHSQTVATPQGTLVGISALIPSPLCLPSAGNAPHSSKQKGRVPIKVIPQVSILGHHRAGWRSWGADLEVRGHPIPTPPLPRQQLWTSPSTSLGLSFLLCKKDSECAYVVPNLKFSDEFKDPAWSPEYIDWLPALGFQESAMRTQNRGH